MSSPLDLAVSALDAPTGERVRRALSWMGQRGIPESTPLLATYLSDVLPEAYGGDDREQHEVAWALGDVYAAAGLPQQAALCRAGSTHERLAVWHWIHSFPEVPTAFWLPALAALRRPAVVPARAALSLSSTRALLDAVGDGLLLTRAGDLPADVVVALDDRFRWTEEFPWMRPGVGIAPLRFLHQHVVAQRLLENDGSRLVRTPLGEACLHDTARLWRRMVDPAPRWPGPFERDTLGVLAASVLRSADFALGRVGEEVAHVLAAKWRPAHQGSLFDGASLVAQAWYQTGVPLGWWDTGRGPADRRPNAFGRAAAVAVFRAVAGPSRAAPG
jgi:hypothetical protein